MFLSYCVVCSYSFFKSLRNTNIVDTYISFFMLVKSISFLCSTSQLVLNGFNGHLQSSVHFPLISAVNKSQQHWYKFLGTPRIEPEPLGEKQECYLCALQPPFYWINFMLKATVLNKTQSYWEGELNVGQEPSKDSEIQAGTEIDISFDFSANFLCQDFWFPFPPNWNYVNKYGLELCHAIDIHC